MILFFENYFWIRLKYDYKVKPREIHYLKAFETIPSCECIQENQIILNLKFIY